MKKTTAIHNGRALNTGNLKEELWETLNMVKRKNMAPAVANSVAKQAREIINIVKVELAAMSFSGKKADSDYVKTLTGK